MAFFDYFRKTEKQSADTAKERLQVIVAHQRSLNSAPDYLPRLQNELLQVIRKYVLVDDDAVNVQLDREGSVEVLELNITLPERNES